jgi:Cu-Zn family superoxide dismutase
LERKSGFAAGLLVLVSSLVRPRGRRLGIRPSAVLKDASGKEVGRVELAPRSHWHSSGRPRPPRAWGRQCDSPDFKSADAHFNPDETKPGLMNAEGPHAGDMPNLHVVESGELVVEVLDDMVTLDAVRALLEGSVLVIHGSADDYRTDPAGNAGDRIARGVVTP